MLIQYPIVVIPLLLQIELAILNNNFFQHHLVLFNKRFLEEDVARGFRYLEIISAAPFIARILPLLKDSICNRVLRPQFIKRKF